MSHAIKPPPQPPSEATSDSDEPYPLKVYNVGITDVSKIKVGEGLFLVEIIGTVEEEQKGYSEEEPGILFTGRVIRAGGVRQIGKPSEWHHDYPVDSVILGKYDGYTPALVMNKTIYMVLASADVVLKF